MRRNLERERYLRLEWNAKLYRRRLIKDFAAVCARALGSQFAELIVQLIK